MRKLAKSMCAIAFAAVPMLAAATPSYALFGSWYPDDEPPAAGDCAAIVSRIGPDATWYGEFAGRYYDEFRNMRFPYSARGCFESEYACRVWQGNSMTYTGRGGMLWSRCTPGAPNRY